MRLRAEITIDIDAEDFIDAAQHQKRVEEIFTKVKTQYEQAQVAFRRRGNRAGGTAPAHRVLHYTGRMCEYEE